MAYERQPSVMNVAFLPTDRSRVFVEDLDLTAFVPDPDETRGSRKMVYTGVRKGLVITRPDESRERFILGSRGHRLLRTGTRVVEAEFRFFR